MIFDKFELRLIREKYPEDFNTILEMLEIKETSVDQPDKVTHLIDNRLELILKTDNIFEFLRDLLSVVKDPKGLIINELISEIVANEAIIKQKIKKDVR